MQATRTKAQKTTRGWEQGTVGVLLVSVSLLERSMAQIYILSISQFRGMSLHRLITGEFYCKSEFYT